MNTIATQSLPNEAQTPAQQMRALTARMDHALHMARLAVEQYEALVTAPAETTGTAQPRRPHPGSSFLHFARVIQNCILGQSRLAAGLPAACPAARRTHARKAASPMSIAPMPVAAIPAVPILVAEESRAEPDPQRDEGSGARPEIPGAPIRPHPRRTAALQNRLGRVGHKAGIRLHPAPLRQAARNLACGIRAAPA